MDLVGSFKTWLTVKYLAFHAHLTSSSSCDMFEDWILNDRGAAGGNSVTKADESFLASFNQKALDAYSFYFHNVEEADFGCVRIFKLKLGDEDVAFVKVSTDGDDGWCEAYSKNTLIAGGRTYLELIHWMDNIDDLRSYVTNLDSQYPVDFDISKTKWGTPLPWL